MLDELFLQVMDRSVIASVVIGIVLFARLLLKRQPKILSYALWGVVLFRLLCPLSIEAPVSMIPDIAPVSQNYRLADEPISAGEFGVPHIQTAETNENGKTRSVTSNGREVWIRFGPYIWIAGVAVLLIYGAAAYWNIHQKLKVIVPLRDPIYIADDIQSPFVIGLIRPRIYLPCGLSGKEQEYIILHEQHHIKRLDHIFKAMAFLALCIHWFNPLVWLAFVLAGQDMEMSCDEAVIRKMGKEIRADYSASLLMLAIGHRRIAGTPLAFGEGDPKRRIKNLSRWKKPAAWAVLAAAAACIALAACLLTNPKRVRFSEEADTVRKWFDYLEAPDEMPWDGHLEIHIPEFPDMTFRWYPEKIEAVTDQEILPLYTGMPIWNAYFCDLTGDGLPELCSSLSFGSGVIDNRIMIYDYANGASYEMEDRMTYDYTIRLNDGDGRLYVDKKIYGRNELVSSGRLVFEEDCIQILAQEAEGDALSAAISAAILEHYASGRPDGLIQVESHMLLANEVISGAAQADADHHAEQITVYLLVLHETYSTYGGVLEAKGGSYVPTAITFSVSESGEYMQTEYWEPRDGGYYTKDIRAKFPGAAVEDVWNAQTYIEELKVQCRAKALAYLNDTGGLDVRIAELLDTIPSSPAASSNPSDYIRAHQEEYQELLGYGEYSLRYCFSKFLKGGQTDLKGQIMASVCQEIMLHCGEDLALDNMVSTGQAWFDGIRDLTPVLQANHTPEELEKQHPAVWLLLQMTDD